MKQDKQTIGKEIILDWAEPVEIAELRRLREDWDRPDPPYIEYVEWTSV